MAGVENEKRGMLGEVGMNWWETTRPGCAFWSLYPFVLKDFEVLGVGGEWMRKGRQR